jgi:hypothetical protein
MFRRVAIDEIFTSHTLLVSLSTASGLQNTPSTLS